MILFPRPPLTIDLDRGPLQVALRKPPEIFRPSRESAPQISPMLSTAVLQSGMMPGLTKVSTRGLTVNGCDVFPRLN